MSGLKATQKIRFRLWLAKDVIKRGHLCGVWASPSSTRLVSIRANAELQPSWSNCNLEDVFQNLVWNVLKN